MRLSVFDALHAQTCTPVDIEWPALAAYLASPPEYPSKESCPLFKLGEFGAVYSVKGSLRHDANVTAICGVEGDHDAGTMTPEDACNRLIAAGITGVIYTSASHTPARPRWRAVVPTSQRYAPESRRELAGRLNAVLGGTLSNETFVLSQAFYFGRVQGVPYVVYGAPGQYIDLVPGLAAVFPASSHTHEVGDLTLSSAPVPEWRGPTDDNDLLRRALQSRSAGAAFGTRASFADLWEADVNALSKVFPDPSRAYDASSADAALIAHLAFWTGRHGERILSIMQREDCKLRRDKWLRGDGTEYLRRSIAAVLARPGDVLTDKQPEPASVTAAIPQAPQQTDVIGNTFLTADHQKTIFAGCVYVTDRHKVLVPGGNLLDQGQFRVAFGGYVFSMDAVNERTTRNAWEAFTESQILRAPRADTTCFRPDQPPGAVIEDGGRMCANTYWPANIRRTPGDPGPFITHLSKLFPDERDRMIILCYMAAVVQHKGVKFQWAPVLQGVEGNGKTLLAAMVAAAIGQHYTHWPDAKDLSSPFNGWLANRLFIAVEELYRPQNKNDVVEDLKTIITGSYGKQIQYKGVDQTSMKIVCNLMLMTNHKGAIRKTADNGRRYGIFYTPQQHVSDLTAWGMTGDYFPNLVDWLQNRDGFAIVADLLHEYPIPREFNPLYMSRAPANTSTSAVIEESRGGIEQQIAEVIAQDTPGFMGGWVSSVMLDRLITDTLKMGNHITHARRRELMQGMGYILHPGLPDGRVNNPVMPDGRRAQLFVIIDSPQSRITGPSEIAKAYTQAQTLKGTTV